MNRQFEPTALGIDCDVHHVIPDLDGVLLYAWRSATVEHTLVLVRAEWDFGSRICGILNQKEIC